MLYEIRLCVNGKRNEAVEKIFEEVARQRKCRRGPWVSVLTSGDVHEDPMGDVVEYWFLGPRRALGEIVQKLRDQGVKVEDPSPESF